MTAPSGPPLLHIDGPLAVLSLQRPQQANRLETDDLAVIRRHLRTVDAEPGVQVLRIEATGRHFCSGYDIGAIAPERVGDFDAMVQALEDARPVTLAVLQGGAYGGATDMALACDFRLGADSIDMFMPAARLGLHYYQRGLERFVSRLGLDAAKRIFLTGERLDAAAMLQIGFLTHRVPSDDLTTTAAQLTATLVSQAPLPLLGMKKHLNRIARGRLKPDELQADFDRALRSDDLVEGRTAWQERRPPRFQGR